MDQSRDAQIISDVVEGRTGWPLLGPVAGGTFFHLGPAYYYFSIFSAYIFGNYPDKMAYPSLFFSILAIPFLYFFSKKYFSSRVSLVLVSVMSFSYFFIEKSRFSSNPNLIPFFVLLFLYALFRLVTDREEKKWQWLVIVGFSVGIGVQLHTILLFSLPVFVLLVFLLFDPKRKFTLVQFMSVVAIALFCNIPQFVHEYRTGWSNMESFFDGIVEKEAEKSSFAERAGKTAMCQIRANAAMVLSLRAEEECSKSMNWDIKEGGKKFFSEINDRTERKNIYLANVLVTLAFSALGYILILYYFFKEKIQEKKILLKLVLLYNFCVLFFLIPMISLISIDYFNVVFITPLFFLGFILKFIEEKIRKTRIIACVLVVIILLFIISVDFRMYSHYARQADNNLENSNLKWAEDAGDYLNRNIADDQQIVYVSGEKKYLDRFFGPIEYMLSKEGKEAIEVGAADISEVIPSGHDFIYIKDWDEKPKRDVKGYSVEKYETFPPAGIYFLKK